MERVLTSAVQALIFVVCAAFLLSCSGDDKQLSKTDVQLAAADLRSFAASTKMLVDQCTQQRATNTFCSEQAELLESKVEDTARELNGHGGPVESEREQLAEICLELREIVFRAEQLSSAASDSADAEGLSLRAKTVEDSLRK